MINKKNTEQMPGAYTEKIEPKGEALDFVNLMNNVYQKNSKELAILEAEQVEQVDTAYNGQILNWLKDQNIGITLFWDSLDSRLNYRLLKVDIEDGKSRGEYIGMWYNSQEKCILDALKQALKWIRGELENEGFYDNSKKLHEIEKEKENQRLIKIFKEKFPQNKQEKLDL